MAYEFKTEPFSHQREEFERSKDMAVRAIFWEQGTGKSKLVVDTAGHLWSEGEIDTLLVIAPNGVHRNWTNREIVAHLPDSILRDTYSFCYRSPKASTKWHQAMAERALKHEGFTVVAMSYDGAVTPKGRKYLHQILKGRRCLYVLDESSSIKTPKAKRTQWIVSTGVHASYKRILDGTPVTQGPFDLYAPMRFLSSGFWKQFDLADFSTFKSYFGIFTTEYNHAQEREYKVLVGYRFLDQLKRMIKPWSTRVLKEDVLDLPAKLYSYRSYELTPKQEKLYKEIEQEFMALIAETGELVTAELAIVRLLRLQQIVCGYIPTESDEEPIHRIEEKNPRIEVLVELCETLDHQAIIWARFTEDVNQIMELLGDEAVRYDGQCTDKEREAALDAFHSGKAKFFVSKPSAGGTGLTLTEAKTVIYYSNSFVLRERLQSEDRAHRIGQDQKVNYIDICADGTVDEHIIDSLKRKFDIACEINGDMAKEWLQ